MRERRHGVCFLGMRSAGGGERVPVGESRKWLFRVVLFFGVLMGNTLFSSFEALNDFVSLSWDGTRAFPGAAEAEEHPWIEHEICSGDNLEKIGARYGVDARAILCANELTGHTILGTGEHLLVPRTQVDIPATLAEVRLRRRDASDGEGSEFPGHWTERGEEEQRLITAGGIAAQLPRGASLPSSSVLRPFGPDRDVNRGGSNLEQRQRGVYVWPVSGEVSSPFGWRRGRNGRKYFHDGMDIRSPKGTPILAARDGTVLRTGSYHGYGKTVTVDHGGGVLTSYSHCQEILVRKGDVIRQGQKIATVGRTGRTTGYHLHFRVIVNGKVIDPADFLPGR